MPRGNAESIVRRALEAFARGDLEELRGFIHPSAEVELSTLKGSLALGPEGVVAALRDDPGVVAADAVYGLAPQAAVVCGTSGADRVVWLVVVNRGLVWRVRLYRSRLEAEEAYETQFRSFLAPG